MSTINAQNYGDGTSSVPASRLVEGTLSARAYLDVSASALLRDYNVSSLTDNSTGDFDFNLTNALASNLWPLGIANADASTGNGIQAKNTLSNRVHTLSRRDNSSDYTDYDLTWVLSGDLA